MSVRASQANLADALKQLHQRWARIREKWDDGASRQIQAEFIDTQDSMVRAAIQSLNQVDDLMASARRDCADDA